MKTDDKAITLRPIAAEDQDFLLRLYRSSRGDDLRELGWSEERISEFLEMQHEAQRNFLATDYPNLVDQIVSVDGQPAGRLAVEQRPNEIRLIDLALLPERRGHGLGTRLIQQVQEHAQSARLPLRLQVIRFNRAVALFERLGFTRTSETGSHFQMEWTPRNSKTPTVGRG
jgi:ribosomal protein S18 acetylase RimI-like enzyme